MKKTFLSLFILSIVLVFSSCKQNTEKMIIGSWNNTSTSVNKLDELSQALLKTNKAYLQNQKDAYEKQLQTMNDSTKKIYTQIIATIDQQINNLNVDTIKNSIKNNYRIGTFIFNKDKTLTIKAPKRRDSAIGSWSISKDTLNLTIQNNQIPLLIKKISSKTLTLVQESHLDSLKYEITYSFDKN